MKDKPESSGWKANVRRHIRRVVDALGVIPYTLNRYRTIIRVTRRLAAHEVGTLATAGLLVAIPVAMVITGVNAALMIGSPQREALQWLGAESGLEAVIVPLGDHAIRQDPYGQATVSIGDAATPVSKASIEAILGPDVTLSSLHFCAAGMLSTESGGHTSIFLSGTTSSVHLPTSGNGTRPLRTNEFMVSKDIARRLDIPLGTAVDISCTDDNQPLLSDQFPVQGGAIVNQRSLDVGQVWEERAHASAHSRSGKAQLVGTFEGNAEAAVGAGTLPQLNSDEWAASHSWLVSGSAPVTWEHVQALNDQGALVLSRHVLSDPPSDADLDPRVLAHFNYGAQPTGFTLALNWQVLESIEAEIGATVGRGIVQLGIAVLIFLELVLLVIPLYTAFRRRHLGVFAQLITLGARRCDLRNVHLFLAWDVGVFSGLVSALLVIEAQLMLQYYLAVPTWGSTWLAALVAFFAPLVVCLVASIEAAIRGSHTHAVSVLSGRYRDRSRLVVKHPAYPVAFVLGLVTMVIAASNGMVVMAIVAAVIQLLGLIGSIPWLLTGPLSYKGTRNIAWRLALRDCVRAGHRSFPAMAALLTAVLVASTALVLSESREESMWEGDAHLGARGDIVVIAANSSVADPQISSHFRRASLIVQSRLGDCANVIIRGALASSNSEAQHRSLEVLQADTDTVVDSHGERTLSGGMDVAYLVDNGTWLRTSETFGGDSLRRANDVLANGGVILPTAEAVSKDGVAWLRSVTATDNQQTARSAVSARTEQFPAIYSDKVAVPVLSDTAATKLGLQIDSIGLLIRPAEPVSSFAASDVEEAIALAYPNSTVHVVTPKPTVLPLIITFVVFLTVFSAIGLVAAVTSGRARRDSELLEAIGSTPDLRLKMGAARGLILALYSAPPAVLAGTVIGSAIVWAVSSDPARQSNVSASFVLSVPWFGLVLLAIAVPILSSGLSALLLPPRHGLTRRLA